MIGFRPAGVARRRQRSSGGRPLRAGAPAGDTPARRRRQAQDTPNQSIWRPAAASALWRRPRAPAHCHGRARAKLPARLIVFINAPVGPQGARRGPLAGGRRWRRASAPGALAWQARRRARLEGRPRPAPGPFASKWRRVSARRTIGMPLASGRPAPHLHGRRAICCFGSHKSSPGAPWRPPGTCSPGSNCVTAQSGAAFVRLSVRLTRPQWWARARPGAPAPSRCARLARLRQRAGARLAGANRSRATWPLAR